MLCRTFSTACRCDKILPHNAGFCRAEAVDKDAIGAEAIAKSGDMPVVGLVAFEAGIDYDIELSGGLKSMMFGGEGLFLATLEGHGKVWLQSLPFARLADRVLDNAVHLKRKGES